MDNINSSMVSTSSTPHEGGGAKESKIDDKKLLPIVVELNPDMLTFADATAIRTVSKAFNNLISLRTVDIKLSKAIDRIIKGLLIRVRRIEQEEVKIYENGEPKFKGLSPWQVRLMKLIGMQKRMQKGPESRQQLTKDMKTLETIVRKALPILPTNTDKLVIASLFAAEGLFRIPLMINRHLTGVGFLILEEEFTYQPYELLSSYLFKRNLDPSDIDLEEKLQIAALIYQTRTNEAAMRLPRLKEESRIFMREVIALIFADHQIDNALALISDLPFASDTHLELSRIYRSIFSTYLTSQDGLNDLKIEELGKLSPAVYKKALRIAYAWCLITFVDTDLNSDVTLSREQKRKYLKEALLAIKLVNDPQVTHQEASTLAHEASKIEASDIVRNVLKILSKDLKDTYYIIQAVWKLLTSDDVKLSKSIATALLEMGKESIAPKIISDTGIWSQFLILAIRNPESVSEKIEEISFLLEVVDKCLEEKDNSYEAVVLIMIEVRHAMENVSPEDNQQYNNKINEVINKIQNKEKKMMLLQHFHQFLSIYATEE